MAGASRSIPVKACFPARSASHGRTALFGVCLIGVVSGCCGDSQTTCCSCQIGRARPGEFRGGHALDPGPKSERPVAVAHHVIRRCGAASVAWIQGARSRPAPLCSASGLQLAGVLGMVGHHGRQVCSGCDSMEPARSIHLQPGGGNDQLAAGKQRQDFQHESDRR